jgi:hypothetical protein
MITNVSKRDNRSFQTNGHFRKETGRYAVNCTATNIESREATFTSSKTPAGDPALSPCFQRGVSESVLQVVVVAGVGRLWFCGVACWEAYGLYPCIFRQLH